MISGTGWRSFVLTSRDGEQWELRDVGDVYTRLIDLGATWQVESNNLGWPRVDALVWDGRQFLAADPNGIMMASTDGIAWERRLPREQSVGGSEVAHSVDGLHWKIQARPKETRYLCSIASGPDGFVATGLGNHGWNPWHLARASTSASSVADR